MLLPTLHVSLQNFSATFENLLMSSGQSYLSEHQELFSTRRHLLTEIYHQVNRVSAINPLRFKRNTSCTKSNLAVVAIMSTSSIPIIYCLHPTDHIYTPITRPPSPFILTVSYIPSSNDHFPRSVSYLFSIHHHFLFQLPALLSVLFSFLVATRSQNFSVPNLTLNILRFSAYYTLF